MNNVYDIAVQKRLAFYRSFGMMHTLRRMVVRPWSQWQSFSYGSIHVSFILDIQNDLFIVPCWRDRENGFEYADREGSFIGAPPGATLDQLITLSEVAALERSIFHKMFREKYDAHVCKTIDKDIDLLKKEIQEPSLPVKLLMQLDSL